MDLRKFVTPEIVHGPGALQLAGRYARNIGAHRVLIEIGAWRDARPVFRPDETRPCDGRVSR